MQQDDRRLRLSTLALALGIAGIVVLRILGDGVPPYGTDGAQYIEHIARLTARSHLQNWDGWNLWTALVAADGSFPATLHFLTLPFGAVFGHSAETTTLTGICWLGLLATAVGSVTRRVSGRSDLGWMALSACLLVPAFHGMAARYYYDLPMLAMLWAGVALMVRAQGARLILYGLLAGCCFLLACLIKWSAIPYGLFLGFGALLLPRHGAAPSIRGRVSLALITGMPVALGLALYFGGIEGISSFGHQAHITVPAAQQQHGQAGPSLGGLVLLFGELPARLAAHSVASLAFYPLRMVSSLLSLPLAVLLGVLLWRWWRGLRLGAAGLATMVGGWTVFHLAVVPVLDDRFLIVVLPAFVVAAALGIGELSAPRARRLTRGIAALGLLTAVDVHFVHEGWLSSPIELISERPVLGDGSLGTPGTVLRGLSSAGSTDHRGWARRDEVGAAGRRADRRTLRDAVWVVAREQQAVVVGGTVESGAIDPAGDRDWWEYRSQLAAWTDGRGATSFSGVSPAAISGSRVCRSSGSALWDNSDPTHLLLPVVSPWARLDPCVRPEDWELTQRIDDPEGGPGVTLWRRRAGASL